MTHGEIVMAAAIINGCRQAKRVTWAVNGDVCNELEGTLRHLSDVSGHGGQADPTRDVMEQFIHVTATVEHWVSVREAMSLMVDGLFQIQG